jgi:molecular chaperone DnaK
LNGVKNGDDLEKIKAATEKLSQEAQKIGQELYKAAQDAQPKAGAEGPARDASQGDAGGGVKDAETEKPADEPKAEEKK